MTAPTNPEASRPKPRRPPSAGSGTINRSAHRAAIYDITRRFEGMRFTEEEIEYLTGQARARLAPPEPLRVGQTVLLYESLDQLPPKTFIHDAQGYGCEKAPDGRWFYPGVLDDERPPLPAKIAYIP